MQAKPPTFDARGDTPGPSDGDGRSRGQTTLDFAVGMSLFLISVAFVISFTPNLVQPFADSGTEDTVIANRVASQLVEGTLVDPAEPYVLDKACTTAFFAPENSDGTTDDRDLNDSNDDLRADNGGDLYDISSDDIWDSTACNFDLIYLHERLGIAGLADDGSVDRALSPGLQIEIRGNASDGDTESGLLCLDAASRDGPDGDSEAPGGRHDPDVEDTIIDTDDAYDGADDCDASSGDYDIPFRVGENPPDDSSSVVVARRIVTIDGIRSTVLVKVW